MSTLIHAKVVKGKKLWYVWGVTGNKKWEWYYPQCQVKSELCNVLRTELGLPLGTRRQEVTKVLLSKTRGKPAG
jgi:hypothetical protein